MRWKSVGCHLQRMGKLAPCSAIQVAVWSTPKWPHWTTATPLWGRGLTPQCLWKASCESDLGVLFFQTPFYFDFLCLYANVYLLPILFAHLFLLMLSTAGIMEPSAEQMQSLCSACARRPAILYETVKPARTTTPSHLSKDSSTTNHKQCHLGFTKYPKKHFIVATYSYWWSTVHTMNKLNTCLQLGWWLFCMVMILPFRPCTNITSALSFTSYLVILPPFLAANSFSPLPCWCAQNSLICALALAPFGAVCSRGLKGAALIGLVYSVSFKIGHLSVLTHPISLM